MPYIGTSPSNGVRRVHTYTATASQTTFTGASSEGITLSYADTNYLDVFQNGVLLGSADYTSTSGTSIVLAQGASVNDLIVIVVYDVFSVADTVSKANGGSFDSAVTMSNNLTVSGAFTSQGIDDNADATAITIDSSENVGIGTSSPTDTASFGKALDVSSSTGAAVYVRDAGGSKTGHFGQFNEQTSIVSRQDDGNIGFYTGASPSEHMRILSNGDVAINSTTTSTSGFSAAHLKVSTDSSKNSITVESNRQNQVAYGVHADGSSGIRYAMYILNGANGEVGKISYTNTTVTYATTSDHRLKENVEDMTGAIDRVKQLSPKRFNFIADDTNTLVDGFLAHEAQSVVAEAVTGTHNEVDDDGNAVMQGIDQAKLVPLLTGALKEAIAKIEALETRVTALENAE